MINRGEILLIFLPEGIRRVSWDVCSQPKEQDGAVSSLIE